MNAQVAKRKGLSVVVVVLILMGLAVPVAMAAPQPPLVLPTPPDTHDLRGKRFGELGRTCISRGHSERFQWQL